MTDSSMKGELKKFLYIAEDEINVIFLEIEIKSKFRPVRGLLANTEKIPS